MSKIILFFLKPLSFLPALAIMYMIYSFSAQTGDVSGNLSYEVSYKLVEIGNQVLDKGFEEWQIEEVAERIEYPVRKLAHMTEYFILAVAVSFPLYVYGLRGFPLMLVAGFICVGFAAADEYHQSFVAGRGPSVRDVGIDSIGVFFGILTVRIVCWTFLAPVRMMERRRERIRRKEARLAAIEARRRAHYEAVEARRQAQREAIEARRAAQREAAYARRQAQREEMEHHYARHDSSKHGTASRHSTASRGWTHSFATRRKSSSSVTVTDFLYNDSFEKELGEEVKKYLP